MLLASRQDFGLSEFQNYSLFQWKYHIAYIWGFLLIVLSDFFYFCRRCKNSSNNNNKTNDVTLSSVKVALPSHTDLFHFAPIPAYWPFIK